MSRARKVAEAVADGLAALGLAALLVLATGTVLDGLSRGLLNSPIDLVREIGDLVAAFSAACCLPTALVHRSNIVLRALAGVRAKWLVRMLDVLASLLVAVVMVAMAAEFYRYAVKASLAGDVTWMMNIPKAPFWYVVDGVLWVAAAVQIVVLIEDLLGKAPPRHEGSGT